MNFYRHVFQGGKEPLHTEFLPILGGLGFFKYNNGPTGESLAGDLPTGYNKNTPFYWKNDTNPKTYLRFYSTDGGSNSWTRFKFQAVNSINYVFDIVPSEAQDQWGVDTSIINEFFIPLKDNGFLLHHNCIWNRSSSTGITNVTPGIIIGGEIMDFLNPDPDGNRNYNVGGSYMMRDYTVIGLPPTTKSVLNEYMYILSSIRSTGNETYNQPLDYWKQQPKDKWMREYANGRNYDQCFAPSLMFSDRVGLYTYPYCNRSGKTNINFIPNVCVLTKMPYENGFIDNLYIMTTCPRSKEQGLTVRGDFFSFNGRNFINIFGNMVLELQGY